MRRFARLGAALTAAAMGLVTTLSIANPASAGPGNPGTAHAGRKGAVTFQYSYATQWLNAGEGSWTFGNVRLTMQTDGNLVMYGKNSGAVRWKSNTQHSGATKMLFQRDGNLVLYKADGNYVWSSGTNNKCRTGVNASPVIALQSDSNFVIYCRYPPASLQPEFVATWSSGTAGAGA